MRWRVIEFSLWVLGALLIAALYFDLQGAVDSWPWIAGTAVLVLLFAIALGARRRLPFGRPL